MRLTKEEIRRKLPGFRTETVILSETGKRLELINEIRGFRDELIFLTVFWVRIANQIDPTYFHCRAYTNIHEAIEEYLKY